MIDRKEHLEWCKQRAYEYLDLGDCTSPATAVSAVMNAWASFLSDMQKHPETKDHGALELGMKLLLIGQNTNVGDMRRFIEGFN